jgi:acetyl-CoA carboxylase/biotin carboxylase 1
MDASLKNRSVVEQFVHRMDGRRVIQRILIANNGMAATKAILSMREWAYNVLGDEKTIEFIAMATRDDLNANAEFVRLADTFIEVPSGSNKNNYANVDLIVKIATEQKVDAVWPGWGHASENPKLPATLKSCGIQFIGPTSSVMAALGDKISANILAQSAKVPSIPWSGEGVESGLNAQGVVPEEIFNKACLFNVEDAAKMAEKIGYPVMIKASEGGGGKGIRMAKSTEELRTNFIQVQNEVPGSPIFMMQLCTEARHLEVQIVGDEHGNAVALNGRDCSTQRRFQKIFEEGPPIIAPPEVFHEMELAAQRLTQSIGYIGAGTVEYLFQAKSQKFYFLELNPRLQVEHPVTEGITGINLPSVQLQVAMGISLNNIPEIRAFYGRDPHDFKSDKIDFMLDRYVYPKNHVIAARITAENPDEGFKPTSGKIERIKFQASKHVWGYFSVGGHGGIHEFADSQFGHLFASGATREDARKSLILALKGTDVRGDIRTTVEYLIKLLETKEFKENTIDTSWLDNIIRQKAVALSLDPEVVSLSAVIFKSHSLIQQQLKELSENLMKGQTSLQSITRLLSFSLQVIFENVSYNYQIQVLGPNYYLITINEQAIYVKIHEQPDKSLLCNINGENYQLFGQEESLGLRMKINNRTIMIPTVYNPSELRSDVTGKIVRYLQQDHDFVAKDTPYVEVEAMKMIMALKATESGQITHQLSPGSIISAGDLVATLKLKDPTRVKPVVTFRKWLSSVPPFDRERDLTNQDIEEKISLALQGYEQEDLHSHLIPKFMEHNELNEILAFITKELQKYAELEKQFDSPDLDESAVISAIVKANKDSAEKVFPVLLARKQLKPRSNAVLELLRCLEALPNKFAFILTAKAIPLELTQSLRDIWEFKNSSPHSRIALKAKQLLDIILMPSFHERLDNLKQELLSSVSLETLSKQSHIAVSVDLLVPLMSDEHEHVGKAAMETFIRRVYRSHAVKSLNIKDIVDTHTNQKIMTAEWTFTLKESVDQPRPLVRKGYMSMFSDFSTIELMLPDVIDRAAEAFKGFGDSSTTDPVNVLHIGFNNNAIPVNTASSPALTRPTGENTIASYGENALISCHPKLQEMGIGMVNLIVINLKSLSQQQSQAEISQQTISYFNYFSDLQYQEDPISRNMRPTLPQLLELNHVVKNHEVTRLPTMGRNSFIFIGKEKSAAKPVSAKSGSGPTSGRHPSAASSLADVLFLRWISLGDDGDNYGVERNFLLALEELERAILDPLLSESSSSRIYMNILTDIPVRLTVTLGKFREIMDLLISKYATRLLKLRVDEIEIKLRVLDDEGREGKYIPIRLISSSSTVGWLICEAFREYIDPLSGQASSYCRLTLSAPESGRPHVSQDSVRISDPYPVSNMLQKKRAAARRLGSTCATDFLGLLEVALNNSWQQYLEAINHSVNKMPTGIIHCEELILDAHSKEVIKMKRFPGNNQIGMLAWHTILKTPQYPQGREVIIIANDVTVQTGSFGVLEDDFFYKISEYARHRGLPKVFISCNAGARIGLVDELKSKFKIAWKDENNIALGYEYLYLTEADYQSLPEGTVEAKVVTTPSGDKHYKLDAIIGKIHGIGVENLKGSGLIAGETSRAYDEIFTLSYVTGRSVGIGAYLNRLGQRVIQMQQGPMILTGYSALNKLLGKEVYTSQDQLGGPQIMYPNGVTHQVVANDREGMQAVIDWLSYVPKDANSIAPPLANSEFIDPVNRLIDFVPSKTPYDPRHMLAGATQSDGSFMTGFLDRGSFKEYLGGWGKSVVVGRGRLGGINVGVIAVETRLSEQRIPADPANPESRESILPQAGQVWFPDSAYKTAQAIQDFNHGENLPLIIFANWRGFSGGTRDMYSEILKYGAMIVDSLRLYKHPVFIYIPPNGELRGGAWVVIDPSINPNKMEMYADIDSRGGILEPPGICEVKYRSQEQVQTMHRLDRQLQEMQESLKNAGNSEEQKQKISNEIKNREKLLLPIYLQVAHEFADLHDRAGRMKAKQCIREVLNWKQSRTFFYYRILRKQKEDSIIEDMIQSIPLAKSVNKLHSLSANEANAKSDFYALIKAKVKKKNFSRFYDSVLIFFVLVLFIV